MALMIEPEPPGLRPDRTRREAAAPHKAEPETPGRAPGPRSGTPSLRFGASFVAAAAEPVTVW